MDVDMNTKQQFHFYSLMLDPIVNLNPLVQPDGAETILRSANQLLYIHHAISQL